MIVYGIEHIKEILKEEGRVGPFKY